MIIVWQHFEIGAINRFWKRCIFWCYRFFFQKNAKYTIGLMWLSVEIISISFCWKLFCDNFYCDHLRRWTLACKSSVLSWEITLSLADHDTSSCAMFQSAKVMPKQVQWSQGFAIPIDPWIFCPTSSSFKMTWKSYSLKSSISASLAYVAL